MNDKLWYIFPAKAWEEALPIGNGKQGAMIYGDACRERISLNEDTLWSGTPRDKNNPDASKYLPEIRNLMEKGDVIGAEELINRHTLGDMSETYLPFCDVDIMSGGAEVTDYRRELDMKNGIFKMTCLKDGKRYSETAFASYTDGLIVIKIESERAEDFKIALSSKLKCTVAPTKSGAVLYGIAPESIFVSTFTEKAAKELLTRISRRLMEEGLKVSPNEMYIGTMHSLFLRVLKEHSEFTRLKKNYKTFDDFDGRLHPAGRDRPPARRWRHGRDRRFQDGQEARREQHGGHGARRQLPAATGGVFAHRRGETWAARIEDASLLHAGGRGKPLRDVGLQSREGRRNAAEVRRDGRANREPPLLEQRRREVRAPLRRLRHAVLLQLQVRSIRNA